MRLRDLGGAVAAVSLGNYAAVGVGIFTAVTLARILGAAEYGRYALLLMVAQVALALGTSWSLTALVRFGARGHALTGTLGTALAARAAVAVPAMVVLLAILWLGRTPLAAYLGVAEGALIAVAVQLIGSALAQTFAGTLQAAGRMALYGASLLAERVVTLAAILALAALAPFDAVLAIWAGAAGAGVSALASLGVAWRAGLLRDLRLDREVLGGYWRFSLPQLGGGWAGIFGSQWIDYVIIRAFLTLDDLGVYALAFQIAGAVQQLAVVLATVLLPRVSAMAARGEHVAVRAFLGRVVPGWLAAYGALCAIGIVAAGPLVPALFGARFAGAVAPLSILLVAAAVAAIFHTLHPVLAAYAIVWPVTAGVVAGVAANVILDLVLIPTLGVTGSALATLGANAVSALAVMAVAQARLGAATARYALCILAPAGAAVAMAFLRVAR